MDKLTYRRDIFSVKTLQEAKSIILTPEEYATVEQRWEKETPVMAGIIGRALSLDKSKTVLDYGCGIGRLSKALIDTYGCSIVGVDISKEMLELANEYVGSERFSAFHPDALEEMAKNGLSIDNAISIYVLQHTLRPAVEIARIFSALKSGGKLLVLNNKQRCVPTNQGWINDGKDVRDLLCKYFREDISIKLPADVFGDPLVERTFCNLYEKI